MECCSRERDNQVHRPGREGGQGISMTRIIRGVWVPAFGKKDYGLHSPFQSHRSLCFYFGTFLHLELSFPRHSPGWLPCLPQASPSLTILFKITTPSSLFPSHNLMFSISLITIGYHISTYLFITYLSLSEMLLPQQRNFYLFCLLPCISSLTHNRCSIVCVQWMNEWTYIEHLLCIEYYMSPSHSLYHLILTKIFGGGYCYHPVFLIRKLSRRS